MPCRVKVDPYVVLGLMPCKDRTRGDCVGSGSVEIIDPDVQEQHHLDRLAQRS